MQNPHTYQSQGTCSCKSVLLSLIASREKELEALRKVLCSLPPTDSHTVNFEKLLWKGKGNSLKIFFNLLNKENLIPRDYKWEFFKPHFIEGDIIQGEIPWKGAVNELAYLIKCLREEKLITEHPTPHIQLQKHFLDKYNRLFKNGVLRSSLDKGIRRGDREELIEEIIEKVVCENNHQ